MSSPVETVALRWKQFQVAATRVSGFVVSPGRTEHCISRLQDASFACLRARFRLRRSLGAVWSSVFVPGLCAVLLGYLSLWIPLHSLYVQPRASVLLIAIAIVCVQFLTLSFAQLPLAQPNHNGALRTWLIVCLSFCLAAFGEFVLAIYHQRLRGALVRQWVDQQNRKNQNTLVRGATIALRNRSQPLPMDSMAGNHRSNSINSSHPPVQPMHHDPASRVPLPMTTSSNSVHYASADVPIDDHQSANHSTIDPSISSRLLSKLLMLNQTPADEKEQFENVWLDQLFKILYPISFVVIAIVYVLVNIWFCSSSFSSCILSTVFWKASK